ncbi:Putative protein of unknown function [Podospora comata]|uniref:Uncharacterized protein n=1 Tax=Podospora comata TaxID=48703 RepID=A0ABY6SEQ0_PODCO|nr:Putative protein of unknown function [Podospora comata]
MELFKEFKFDEDISLGSIFPSLKGTDFDALTMKNTSMIWLGRDASALKKAGLWFETDVEFRGLLQPIHDVLRDVFAQEQPGLHLSAHLGIQQDYSDDLIATGFTFKGSINGINRGFGEFLTFRNAGVELNVVPSKGVDLETMWGFFGTLHLAIPNSVVPLVLEYKLQPKADSLDIAMNFGGSEKWESVFGVSGLDASVPLVHLGNQPLTECGFSSTKSPLGLQSSSRTLGGPWSSLFCHPGISVALLLS